MSVIRSGRYYDYGVYVVNDILSGFNNSDMRNYMNKTVRRNDPEAGTKLIVPTIGEDNIVDVEVIETS